MTEVLVAVTVEAAPSPRASACNATSNGGTVMMAAGHHRWRSGCLPTGRAIDRKIGYLDVV